MNQALYAHMNNKRKRKKNKKIKIISKHFAKEDSCTQYIKTSLKV
jgi:hypothetical protein